MPALFLIAGQAMVTHGVQREETPYPCKWTATWLCGSRGGDLSFCRVGDKMAVCNTGGGDLNFSKVDDSVSSWLPRNDQTFLNVGHGVTFSIAMERRDLCQLVGF